MAQALRDAQKFLPDAEADGRIKNLVFYTHNKFLSMAGSEFRYFNLTPAGISERVANQFEQERRPLQEAINILSGEHQRLNKLKGEPLIEDEAKFFAEAVMELKRIKERGLLVENVHRDFLDVRLEDGKEMRLFSQPLLVAGAIAKQCELTHNLIPDVVEILKKEQKRLVEEKSDSSLAEAAYFGQIIPELRKIEKKKLESKEVVPGTLDAYIGGVVKKIPSDRFEFMPKEEREFWAKGDSTIIADPAEFTRMRFNQFSNVVIKEVERSPEGEEKMVEKPWVSQDTFPAATAEKIANQFRGEKLPKVAEMLEKAAEKCDDKKEKSYFLEVANELRLKYESY